MRRSAPVIDSYFTLSDPSSVTQPENTKTDLSVRIVGFESSIERKSSFDIVELGNILLSNAPKLSLWALGEQAALSSPYGHMPFTFGKNLPGRVRAVYEKLPAQIAGRSTSYSHCVGQNGGEGETRGRA